MKKSYPFENHNIYFRFLEAQQIRDISLMAVGFEKCISKKPAIEGTKKYFILHYIISGEGYFELNGKIIKLKPKTLFLIPPALPVSYYPDNKNPWQYMWIECIGSLSNDVFKQAGFTNDCLVLENVEEVEESFAELINESYENHNGFIYGIMGKFFEIIYTLTKKHTPLVQKNTMHEITEYIKQNYFDPHLSIEGIAHKFGISLPYLSRIFKKEEGVSPIKYLLNTRMEHACHLLSTQHYTISEVAYAVGFNSPFYFSNVFKKMYGFSPSAYSTQVVFE